MNQTIKLMAAGILVATISPNVSCSNVNSDPVAEQSGSRELIPLVEIVKAREGNLPLQERLTGGVRARNQTDIYPEIGGRIVEVRVNNGDRVSRGEVLVRLRDDEYRDRLRQSRHDLEVVQAQLRQAEARLRRLQAQYRRTKELVELELEAEIQLETLEADIQEAEASIDLARAQLRRAEAQIEEQANALENTVVTAPIHGVVGNRNAEIGMRVDTGTRLFEIGDTTNMQVTLTLTERLSNRLRRGDGVEIHSPYLEEPIVSSIRRLSPFLDPVTHSTVAEVEVGNPDGRLQPGMFVSVDVFYGESEEATIVPTAALYENAASGVVGAYVADLDGSQGVFRSPPNPDEEARPQRLGPVPIHFVPVEVVTDGRALASVRGLAGLGTWVVINGQNQLAEWESEEAYIQKADWEQVLRLQRLQTRDLLPGLVGGANVESTPGSQE